MMPAVIRIGDPGSHGGSVTTGSPDTTVNGLAVARVGDTYDCPDHGPNPIVTGSPDTTVNGLAVARVGDTTACGATLQGGSPDVEVN
jgi:uncharacterized Zn-binding protein involved in type VI secretion